MHFETDCALVPLRGHVPQRLHAPAGTVVKGLRGSTWLTRDHDRRDLVLEAGDEYLAVQAQDLMLSALGGQALVKVWQPAAPVRAARPAVAPRRRPMAWLQRALGSG